MRQSRLNTPEKRARVGERIKIAATQAGLTLKELSERAETTPALVYQYVRGITSVPPETLENIARVTRVHTDFFDPEKDARSSLALPTDAPVGEGQPLTRMTTEPATRARIQAELRHLHQLAEAQDFPKRNRPAYMATLEQMLSLARTLENRQQEAWVLWRLGCSYIEDNNLEEAKQTILVARELFADEGMEEYHAHATQDLAHALSNQGEFEAAEHYMEALVKSINRDVRWRALIMLGSLRYRQHDYEGALRYFGRAAEQLEDAEPETRDGEGMPRLMLHVADVVRATGHYEEAMMLWSRCLQQAAVERKADQFLESLMEIAQCCQIMGRISEAKQRLELAVVLASFLFEDEARLSVARAMLAEVLVAMGSLDEAKENARTSLRIANQVRGARQTILSTLALAETNLAAGQWEDALVYAQEALNEAKRTGRTREVAQAYELRARAHLRHHEEALTAGASDEAQEALDKAFADGGLAYDLAARSESAREMAAARLTLARCSFRKGDEATAEREAREVLTMTQSGAVGLTRLLGNAAEQTLPALLRSPMLDLPALFTGRRLNLPSLEWQAHYLEGTVLAKRLGPDAAFSAMREAAKAIARLVSGLTQAEAATFQERHPEVKSVFQDLKRYAVTEAAKEESEALLESARWTGPERFPPLLPSGI